VTRGRADGTHDEGGYEIFANNIPIHIGFSETERTHGTQADPEGIVYDPQLCLGPHILARIRTEVREFISALVSDDTQTANSDILQCARVSENKRQNNGMADEARTRRRPSRPESS